MIDLAATGDNIRRLRIERGLTVKDVQSYFGFEEPRAIYKWQSGQTLPSVDNLYALGSLLEVPMDRILVPAAIKLHMNGEQQAETCCSILYLTGCFGCGRSPMQLQPFARSRSGRRDGSRSPRRSRKETLRIPDSEITVSRQARRGEPQSWRRKKGRRI